MPFAIDETRNLLLIRVYTSDGLILLVLIRSSFLDLDYLLYFTSEDREGRLLL